jgi:uncharacterized membrane protein YkoI
MIKRTIMTLLVVVAISTAVISVFAVSNENNSSNNIGSDQLTQLTTPSSTNINTNLLSTGQTNKNHNFKNHFTLTTVLPVIISPTEAQKIAIKYIKQPGATAGTPELVKQDNKKVYIVPVIYKTKNVGEIDLDAHNGKNIGGAGGAPIN